MNGAACPDCTRRIHALSPDSNGPNAAGIVRVDSCPSWWQPMQPLFFTTVSQSLWVTFAGMLLLPPN